MEFNANRIDEYNQRMDEDKKHKMRWNSQRKTCQNIEFSNGKLDINTGFNDDRIRWIDEAQVAKTNGVRVDESG